MLKELVNYKGGTMLKELLKAFTGSATTTAFTSPAGYGISNVSPQATFRNFFSTLTSSFNNTPQAIFGNQIPGYGGTGIGAIQAYRNVQGQFAAPQYYQGDTPNRTLKAQAFAPGAVIVNSPSAPIQPPAAQGINQGFFGPNQLAGLSPLQGSALQNGSTFGGPQGFVAPFGGQVPYPVGPAGLAQNGIGKLQFLLMPIISIFSFVKSLFGVRGVVNSLKPVQVDRNDLNFYDYQNSYSAFERQEGSFDEYYPEQYETEGFESQKLQTF